jgi:hypothetical protein
MGVCSRPFSCGAPDSTTLACICLTC